MLSPDRHRLPARIAVLLAALLGLACHPHAHAQEIKSAYVQPGMPTRPIWYDVFLNEPRTVAVFGPSGSQVLPSSASGYVLYGPQPSLAGSGGIMGITSITVINTTNANVQVYYSMPFFGTSVSTASTGTISTPCSSPTLVQDGTTPTGSILAPANSTVTVPFPTPLVLNPYGSAPCMKLSSFSAGVEVTINGFIN